MRISIIRVLFDLLGGQSTWLSVPACQLCAGHLCRSLSGVAGRQYSGIGEGSTCGWPRSRESFSSALPFLGEGSLCLATGLLREFWLTFCCVSLDSGSILQEEVIKLVHGGELFSRQILMRH